MKKFLFTSLLLFTMLCAPVLTMASETDSDILYQDNDIIVTYTLKVEPAKHQLFASSQTKSASKTITISNTSGTALANFTVKGDFSYNGSTSSCTAASVSKGILKSGYSFDSASASRSANKAIGSYKLTGTNFSKSGKVTLTCSANGTIS